MSYQTIFFRYKDHLNLEHRVYYFISWIIQKTVEENFKVNISGEEPGLANKPDPGILYLERKENFEILFEFSFFFKDVVLS